MNNYLKKIIDNLPVKKGKYMTNMGELVFDGKSFVIRTGNRFLPTTIEYWLEPVEAAGKPPIVQI